MTTPTPRALPVVRTTIYIILALLFGLVMAFFFTSQYQSAPTPAPTADLADDARQIIYMGNAAGNWDLFQLTIGSREVVNLTNTPADEGFPSYSSDGEAVSYVSSADRAETGELTAYNMNADGSDQRRVVNDLGTILGIVANGRFDWDMVYFGDDRRALVTLRDLNLEVYLGQRGEDGAWADRNVTADGAIDWFPALHRDGRLAFASDRYGNQEMVLYTPGPDGQGELRRLTDHPAYDINAAFADDGRLIFYSERDGFFDGGVLVLYALDLAAADGAPVRLEPGAIAPGVKVDEQTAAAGDLTVYMGWDGEDWELFVQTAGGAIAQLTDNATDDLFPAWR